MDKNLELRLVEAGYGRIPSPITTSQQAGESIRDMAFSTITAQDSYFSDGNHYNLESNMILFDGLTEVTIDSWHTSKSKSPVIAFTASKNKAHLSVPSIQVYTLQDLMEYNIGQRCSESIPLDENYFTDINENKPIHGQGFRVDLKSPKIFFGFRTGDNLHATIYIKPNDGTQILYFKRTPKGNEDNNFLEYIAPQIGLSLTKVPYGYSAECNGSKLNFSGSYITVEFPRKMSKKFLNDLVRGLSVQLIKIDDVEYTMDRKPHIPLGGKSLTVNVDNGVRHNGQATISYLSRLLEKTEK